MLSKSKALLITSATATVLGSTPCILAIEDLIQSQITVIWLKTGVHTSHLTSTGKGPGGLHR